MLLRPKPGSRSGVEFGRRCARSDPGVRRKQRGEVPLSHCTKASLKYRKKNPQLYLLLHVGQVSVYFVLFRCLISNKTSKARGNEERRRFGPAERADPGSCDGFPAGPLHLPDHRSITLLTPYCHTVMEIARGRDGRQHERAFMVTGKLARLWQSGVKHLIPFHPLQLKPAVLTIRNFPYLH